MREKSILYGLIPYFLSHISIFNPIFTGLFKNDSIRNDCFSIELATLFHWFSIKTQVHKNPLPQFKLGMLTKNLTTRK